MAENLTDSLYKQGAISIEEIPIVKFGIDSIQGNLLGILIALIIGGCFGSVLDGFLLWLLVFPLRKNAGGFHAKTRIKCVFLSIGIMLFSYCCYYIITWPVYVYICSAILFAGLIFAIAPIDNEKKILSALEKSVYQKRARMVLVTEVVLFLLAICFQSTRLYRGITMSFFIVIIVLVCGRKEFSKKVMK